MFHGADNDVIWLQRDFHIYVVNMFDTAKACEVLAKPQRSLAYLLESVCGVSTNKLLQVSPLTLMNIYFVFSRPQSIGIYAKLKSYSSMKREDWRQRPLSEEMVRYARTDAHYLLYIADTMTAELRQLGTGRHLY